MKFKDLTTTDQRTIDGKEWIGSGRAHEYHHAVFNIVQQHILLRFVEAVNFVHKQQRATAPSGDFIPGSL